MVRYRKRESDTGWGGSGRSWPDCQSGVNQSTDLPNPNTVATKVRHTVADGGVTGTVARTHQEGTGNLTSGTETAFGLHNLGHMETEADATEETLVTQVEDTVVKKTETGATAETQKTFVFLG